MADYLSGPWDLLSSWWQQQGLRDLPSAHPSVSGWKEVSFHPGEEKTDCGLDHA